MAAVTGHIGVLKDSLVEFETVDHANELTRARLVPETPEQTVRTLVPDGAITDTDSAAWTFEIAGLQKHVTGGLGYLLNTSEPGTLLDVVYEPKAGLVGGVHYEFQVSSKPIPIGGDQGAQGTFELVLSVQGSPVRTTIA
jgi:hypothetical protein